MVEHLLDQILQLKGSARGEMKVLCLKPKEPLPVKVDETGLDRLV